MVGSVELVGLVGQDQLVRSGWLDRVDGATYIEGNYFQRRAGFPYISFPCSFIWSIETFGRFQLLLRETISKIGKGFP